jgi:hypothetical protein
MPMQIIGEPACRPYSGKLEREWTSKRANPEAWLSPSLPRSKAWTPNARAISVEPTVPVGIEEAIVRSRRLLDLRPDWNEDGGEPIAESTLHVATSFLRRTAATIYSTWQVELPAPAIGPCGDGSVDLHWRTPKFKLLVNIQPNSGKSDFYGESPALTIKGTFNPETDALLVGFLGSLVGD